MKKIIRVILIILGICAAIIGALGTWAETSQYATGTLTYPLINLIGGVALALGAWRSKWWRKP